MTGYPVIGAKVEAASIKGDYLFLPSGQVFPISFLFLFKTRPLGQNSKVETSFSLIRNPAKIGNTRIIIALNDEMQSR